MFRQGDVLLILVDFIPKNVSTVPREQDRIVLAHGEATGHAHAIAAPKARLVEDVSSGHRYLDLSTMAWLRHEEHAAIHLPAGHYRVIRQREYTPEAPRWVTD